MTFFAFCILYQFIVHLALSLLGNKEQLKPILDYVSPYAAFVLLAIIYFLFAILKGRGLVIFLGVVLIVLSCDSLLSHLRHGSTFGNSLKSIQYFYGVVIVFIGSVAILEFSRSNQNNLGHVLTRNILIVASVVTLSEFVISNFIFHPSTSFFYKYLDVIITDDLPFRIRPVGIALYAQPNSVFLVYLIMFQLLYWGSITAVSYLGMLAVVASMAGTGISSLAVLLLARNIKLSRRAVIAVISLTLVLTGLLAYFPPIASKLNLEYFRALLEIMFVAYDNFLANFTVAEIVWGTNKFGTEYNPGVTHDWAYFDIFYEYGLVGLFSYLLVYFFVIFNALPRRFSGSLRLLIILFFFGINFHYSALNYFPGQMLFGILGAIGYYLKITKDSAQKSSLPTRA